MPLGLLILVLFESAKFCLSSMGGEYTPTTASTMILVFGTRYMLFLGQLSAVLAGHHVVVGRCSGVRPTAFEKRLCVSVLSSSPCRASISHIRVCARGLVSNAGRPLCA